ncbi:T-lymphocyte activation antigen CD80, partial [Acanthisitta chloris]
TGQALKNVVNTKVGERVSLSCCRQIPSSESLHTYRAYWQKNITEVVIAYSEGNLMPKPMNRTEMDPWNLTLWISPVEIMDNGSYNCVLQQKSVVLCVQPVDLFVTADFSKPKITAEETTNSCESTEMVIMCSSHGGYPKAKISGTINNISVEWNASWVSESSLSPYNVTGKLVHNMTKDINITCSIEYDDFATSTSLFLRKKDNCAVPTVLPSYNVITASSIIVIIFILAVLLAARYLPRLGKCSSFFKK